MTDARSVRHRSWRLWSRISRLEFVVAGVALVVLAVLVALEPDILDAPFASTRAIAFTFGGTAAAALALIAMLRWRVHPIVRVAVLAVPFVAVQWWLISPFFIDDVVDQDFETSIAEQQSLDATSSTTAPASGSSSPPTSVAPTPQGPTLLASGMFAGLAGHEGRGDAGVFRLENGMHVLRFENFDIENGPDLELYVVPGRDRTSIEDGSTHLGSLQGNVGNQTYELPGAGLAAGDWTVLVWCEAFSVEFVSASLTIA